MCGTQLSHPLLGNLINVNQKFNQAVNRGDDLGIAFMKPFRS